MSNKRIGCENFGKFYTEGKVRNLSQAVREVAEHTGLSKNELYAAALERS